MTEIEARVAELIAEAPPITPEQRNEVVRLLARPRADAAAKAA